jgi:hypothetical protein
LATKNAQIYVTGSKFCTEKDGNVICKAMCDTSGMHVIQGLIQFFGGILCKQLWSQSFVEMKICAKIKLGYYNHHWHGRLIMIIIYVPA